MIWPILVLSRCRGIGPPSGIVRGIRCLLAADRVNPRSGSPEISAAGGGLTYCAMNEARLSHLPFWGPSEGFFSY